MSAFSSSSPLVAAAAAAQRSTRTARELSDMADLLTRYLAIPSSGARVDESEYGPLVEMRSPRIMHASGCIAIENNCLLNALYNRDHAYAGLKLRLAFGSIGFGVASPARGVAPWFEFGDPTWTTAEQFSRGHAAPSFDGHMWLVQERTQHIFDVIPRRWWHVAAFHERKILHAAPGQGESSVIAHMTQAKLAQRGLTYIEAPGLAEHFMQRYATSDTGRRALQSLGLSARA